MAKQDVDPDQPMEDVEWGEGGNDLDAEFRAGEAVEITFDDDEAPPDSDDDEEVAMDADDLGALDEEDEDDGEPVIDVSVASGRHKDAVLAVALCPTQHSSMVTGGQDDVAALWKIEQTGDSFACVQICRLEGHTDSVVQVAFSNDGKYVASGSYDGTVRIWEADTGALLHALDGPSKEVEWLMWHPKGHAILAGSADTMAWMWWAPSGKLMQIFAGHAQTVTCGCWGMGGKLICTASEDRSAIVWNPRAGQPQQNVKQLHEGAILSICAHPDSPIMITGSQDGVAKAVHMETGKTIAGLSAHSDSVEAIAFSNSVVNSSGLLLLATASMDGKVVIWDGKTFDLRCELKDHCGGGVVSFKWLPAPHGSMLCTSATDKTLRLFNALAGQCLHTFTGHTDTVLGLDVALGTNPDILYVVSGSDDKTCKVFVQTIGTPASEQQPQGGVEGGAKGGYPAAA